MVNARLHLICGNCGSNDCFEYSNEEVQQDTEEFAVRLETVLVCKNCATIHYLNDYAENKNNKRGGNG